MKCLITNATGSLYILLNLYSSKESLGQAPTISKTSLKMQMKDQEAYEAFVALVNRGLKMQ